MPFPNYRSGPQMMPFLNRPKASQPGMGGAATPGVMPGYPGSSEGSWYPPADPSTPPPGSGGFGLTAPGQLGGSFPGQISAPGGGNVGGIGGGSFPGQPAPRPAMGGLWGNLMSRFGR